MVSHRGRKLLAVFDDDQWVAVLHLLWITARPVAMCAKNTSFLDTDVDLHLKISNYEETVKHLDIYYGIGQSINPPPSPSSDHSFKICYAISQMSILNHILICLMTLCMILMYYILISMLYLERFCFGKVRNFFL